MSEEINVGERRGIELEMVERALSSMWRRREDGENENLFFFSNAMKSNLRNFGRENPLFF